MKYKYSLSLLYLYIHQDIMRKGGSEVTYINEVIITAAVGSVGGKTSKNIFETRIEI